MADAFFHTGGPTEGEAEWTIVCKDDHEEETLQSDDETEKKVMTNGALTTLEHRYPLEATNRGIRLGETSTVPRARMTKRQNA